MPTTFVTYFTDKTEAEARVSFATGNLFCGHRCRTKVQPNDLVLMVNHESGYVVGVARAASTCLDRRTVLNSANQRESQMPEVGATVYSGEDAKYNRYAILIKDLRLLPSFHITQLALRRIVGVDDEDKSKTNIYKGFPNSWQPAFIKNEEAAPGVLACLAAFIEGLLA